MSIWRDPATIEEFKALATGDLSYGEIAKLLSHKYGPVSRSACIGKASRLGLNRPEPTFGTSVRERIARRDRSTPNVPRLRKGKPGQFLFDKVIDRIVEPGIIDLPPDQSAFAVTLADLGAERCRWPLGEPAHDMLYCGAVAESETPYCTRHCCIAYAKRRAA
jgi:hypothetical protein